MRRSLHQLTLLFAIASGHALAVEITGKPGAPGTSGTSPGAAGGAGAAGQELGILVNVATAQTHIVTGGAGGAGGNGAAGDTGQNGGAAGVGGAGGNARLQVYGTPHFPYIFGPYIYAIAKGGDGGNAGLPGAGGAGAADGTYATGGAGGDASVTAVLWPGPRKAEGVTVRATGGKGGKGAGRAGSAQAALALIGYDDTPSSATLEVTAGQGGDALLAGNGADGGAASSSLSAKTAGPGLTLSSSTQGGHGGAGWGIGHRGGAGAVARTTLSASASSGNLKTNIWLGGGLGGPGFGGADGGDGAAMSYTGTPAISTNGKVRHTVSVFGGSAGFSSGGMAGKAGASEAALELSDSKASEIQVFVISHGGSGGYADHGGTTSAGATGLARSNISGLAPVHSNAYGYGGEGGWQDDGGRGAVGGDGYSFSDAAGHSGVFSNASAYGGTGGGARGAGSRGGDGGKGTARASGHGEREVEVGASVRGGAGGMGLAGANGGNGASAHIADSVVGSSNGSLTLGQGAVGGNGGDSEGGVSGSGGNASSRLGWTESKAAQIRVSTGAKGGDSGTGSKGAYAGGSGSASAISALLATAAGAQAEAVSHAQGGFVMLGTLPGDIRAGSANARATVVSAGDGSAYAWAEGGRSINTYRPVRDGSATAHAIAFAAGAAHSEATGIAGTESTSDAIVIVSSEANGGSGAYARAHGWGQNVDAQAKSRAFGAVDNAARTTGYGLQGTLKAESISSSWDRSEAGASAVANINGTALAVVTSANIGGAAPTLQFDPEWHSAFSHAAVAPGEAAHLGDAFANGLLAGIGAMGVLVRPEFPGGPLSTTLTAHYQFDLSAPGQLAFAMLDTLAEQSGFASMALSISNHGAELFTRSFDSLAEVDLFFDHRLLLLGAANAGLQDLLVTAIFTLDQPGGFGFEYALGIAPVPEPQAWLMTVLGLLLIMALVFRPSSALS